MADTLSVVAGRRRVALPFLLAAMTAFPPMAIDQYLPALPGIGRALGTSAGAVQWTLSLFFIGFSAGQLVYGPLSDRLGRRWPLLGGIVLFVVASVGCALSGSIGALIGWRLLQSLGAAAGAVIGRAIVGDLFEGVAAARMLSLMSLIMAAAPLAAPILGGYLTEAFGWASNFWALAVFGMVCLIGAARGLPESLPASRRRGGDVPAILHDYASLLRNARFLGYALASGLSFGGYFAYVSGSPFVFIELYGVPVSHFGFLFGGNVVGMMVGSALNARLVGRVGIDRMLAGALGLSAAAGLVLIGLGATGAGGLWALFGAIFVFVASQGPITANAMAGALSVRPDLAGTAAALAGMSAFLVGALAGGLVNALFDGSALPMAAVIGAAALAAWTVERWLIARPRHRP